ncbi:MAG TPA: hypothetical protein VFM55_00690 [Micromonosporaceae bacterium]|nr:hypothetical protein [Micromonosporaceae bacterium]
MNFVFAVIIGVVVGAIGYFVTREKDRNAIWLAPLLGVVGAVLASIIATVVGDPGYGFKEATLQVVLAVVAVGALAFLATRRGAGQHPQPTGTGQ